MASPPLPTSSGSAVTLRFCSATLPVLTLKVPPRKLVEHKPPNTVLQAAAMIVRADVLATTAPAEDPIAVGSAVPTWLLLVFRVTEGAAISRGLAKPFWPIVFAVMLTLPPEVISSGAVSVPARTSPCPASALSAVMVMLPVPLAVLMPSPPTVTLPVSVPLVAAVMVTLPPVDSPPVMVTSTGAVMLTVSVPALTVPRVIDPVVPEVVEKVVLSGLTPELRE